MNIFSDMNDKSEVAQDNVKAPVSDVSAPVVLVAIANNYEEVTPRNYQSKSAPYIWLTINPDGSWQHSKGFKGVGAEQLKAIL